MHCTRKHCDCISVSLDTGDNVQPHVVRPLHCSRRHCNVVQPVAQAVGNGVCELVPREVELWHGA